ncbi:helix-turn-helix domain-containing protein [Clostridium sp. CS001]|uniref:helix-turn-helix domain-containing protein n=1 Tax=Clostridium sp. CS001 TaxID=2880648 RepID=UPI001CF183C5|nr:helix-turn-helix transcriptional regulator [Clostridium sp. CS001]MCB2290840.1 helix-turn-helix domain-containing protein [Clostridium sp. CS001]
MENTEESFGMLIKKLRKERNLSLKDLSMITTLSDSYISRIENFERKNPSINSINCLKHALNIDIKLIEKLFPCQDQEDKEDDKTEDKIEDLILNNSYLFCNKVAGIEVMFALRELVKEVEKYSMKDICNREDESNILQLVDNLKKVSMEI